MYYLIHTMHHVRPYMTTVAFIARDFRKWGCRVDCHAFDSAYAAEIKSREKKINRTEFRIGLTEIWAHETITRKRQERTHSSQTHIEHSPVETLSQEDRRLKSAADLTEDFVNAIAAFDAPGTKHTSFPIDPRPIPPAPFGLVSKYMRLLHTVRYTSNAQLPAWSNPDIVCADQITLEFRSHEILKQEHLVMAVKQAVCKDQGRMGRVERCKLTGVIKVAMLVDVSECVLSGGCDGNEETRDPVPVYERGEHPPPYRTCLALV